MQEGNPERRTLENEINEAAIRDQSTMSQSTSPGQMGGGGMHGPNKQRLKQAWQSGSPEEVRDEMRRIVEKGVAAISGAIRGFSERAKQDHLSEQAGEAVREAGSTAQSVVQQTGEQARNMREKVRGTTKEIGETTRDVTQEVSREARETRDTMKQEKESFKNKQGSQGSQSGSTGPGGSK